MYGLIGKVDGKFEQLGKEVHNIEKARTLKDMYPADKDVKIIEEVNIERAIALNNALEAKKK